MMDFCTVTRTSVAVNKCGCQQQFHISAYKLTLCPIDVNADGILVTIHIETRGSRPVFVTEARSPRSKKTILT